MGLFPVVVHEYLPSQPTTLASLRKRAIRQNRERWVREETGWGLFLFLFWAAVASTKSLLGPYPRGGLLPEEQKREGEKPKSLLLVT